MSLDKPFNPENSILILGAGFSFGAKNKLDQRVPLGDDLASDMLKRLGFSPPKLPSLKSVSNKFLDQVPGEEVIAFLRERFSGCTPEEWHKKILTHKWKRIFTINYDDLVENTSLEINNKRLGISKKWTMEDALEMKTPLCIHLNGYIQDVGPKIDELLRLSIASYLDPQSLNERLLNQLRSDILTSEEVFVLGSTLESDIELAQILRGGVGSDRLKAKFVLGSELDEFSLEMVGELGENLGFGVEKFAEYLEKRPAYKETNKFSFDNLDHFEELHTTETSALTQPPPKVVQDLFLKGELSSAYLNGSLFKNFNYYIPREPATEAIEYIESGLKVVVIHSELANGKTSLLEEISQRLIVSGKKVIRAKSYDSSAFRELSTVYHKNIPVIVVIDSYSRWLHAIQRAGTSSSNIQFLLSERSSSNNGTIERIKSHFNDSVKEICIDNLHTEEIIKFEELMSVFGFWGEKAGLNNDQKMRELEYGCTSNINKILALIINSPQIKNRITKLIAPLHDDAHLLSAFSKILVLTALDADYLSYPTIRSVVGTIMDRDDFRRNDSILELVDIYTGRLRFNSVKMSQHILKVIFEPEDPRLLNILYEMMSVFSQMHRNPTFSRLGISLMQTSTLQKLFIDGGPKECIKFYEKIIGLEICKNNHDYWLQNAIASTVIGDFDKAFRDLDNAFSIARSRGHSTHRIDNHKARCLLSRAIDYSKLRLNTSIVKTAMSDFRRAHAILIAQAHIKERLDYPYKVAQLYKKFFFSFSDSLSNEQKIEVASSAKRFLERIESVREQRDETYMMVRCVKELKKVVEEECGKDLDL